jgi:MATE family multidrug resistance protein
MSGEAAAAFRAKASAGPIRNDLKTLARLAGPVALGDLGVMAMGLTDTVVVGRYSARELGFLALAWAATSPVLGVGLGLLTGVQVMASRAVGQGEPAAAGAALRRGLVLAIWIGAGSALALGLGMPPILGALGLKGGLAAGSTAPMVILALSMPGFAVSVAAGNWLQGLGRTGAPMVLMWAANVVNLAVDLVLVPGRFGLPAMGAAGAASATFSARAFLALGTLVWIACLKDAGALGVWRRPPPSRADAIEQRRIGYGAAASSFFEMGAFSSMNVIAGWISATAVAAWAVSLNVTAFLFMIPLGVSTGAAVMVSRAFGAGDAAALRRAALLSFSVAGAFGVVAALAVWPTAGWLVGLYATDPPTVALAAVALALSCLFFPPDHLQVVAAQALRARGDVLVPTLTHFVSYVAVMPPLAWFLAIPLHWSLAGIVVAVIASSYLSAGLLLARFWMLERRGRP